MRPRDWFLVAIRVLGAWVFYRGVLELANFLAVVLDVTATYEVERIFGDSKWKAGKNYLLYAAVNLALALYAVFQGESLTKWVFDEYSRESDDEGDS